MSGCVLNRNVRVLHLRDFSHSGGPQDVGDTDNEHKRASTAVINGKSDAWQNGCGQGRSGPRIERTPGSRLDMGRISPGYRIWTKRDLDKIAPERQIGFAHYRGAWLMRRLNRLNLTVTISPHSCQCSIKRVPCSGHFLHSQHNSRLPLAGEEIRGGV
jgi:hypothetical protein